MRKRPTKLKRGRDSFSSKNESRPRFTPRKRFGQHFLSSAWAQKVVAAIAPAPGDVFLEIGPGTGSLTLPLAATGAPIVAVEIDRDLVRLLSGQVPPNVTLLSGDILDVDPMPILRGLEPQRPPGWTGPVPPTRRFRVVGNLPFNIASRVVLNLVEAHGREAFFADATIMLQREVAQRLLGRPGTKDYGTLTVLTTLHARAKALLELPPGAFLPRPKVHSTVLRLEFGAPLARVRDEAGFERLTKALFSQRRKTLANALKRFHPSGTAVLAESGLDGRRRPGTLQVTEIARLAELFASAKRAAVL